MGGSLHDDLLNDIVAELVLDHAADIALALFTFSQKLLEENLTLVRGNVLVARLHHVRRVFVSGQLQ